MPRWLWLALLAVALMMPVALGPLRLNDSHWINYVWADQFTAQIRQGNLWPRWLPQSHGGLGAPDFYFYGPVAFWLAAPFGLIGLSPWLSLVGAATLALWLSGVAMGRYLDCWTRRPALGAALYMTLPYHLIDFAMRGALAEFVAYAILPLVALSIRERRVSALAFSYALLILTHLPTALLASLFLVPPLAVAAAWSDRSALRPIAAGLLLGLMLAAPYLLPAILLQRYAAIATMMAVPALQASRWTILSPDPGIRDGLFMMDLMATAAGLPALLLALRGRDRWGWFVLAVLALALGVVPALWRISLLAKVQFPWRLFVIADFGIALVFARSGWRIERLLLVAVPIFTLSLIILRLPTSNNAAPPLGILQSRHPDVIEYLPSGSSEPYAAYSRHALRIAASMATSRSAGRWTVERLHYFPIWQARCAGIAVPTGPEPGTGLLRYQGRGCTVEQRRTSEENAGWLLGLLGCSLLAGVAFSEAWRSRKHASAAR